MTRQKKKHYTVNGSKKQDVKRAFFFEQYYPHKDVQLYKNRDNRLHMLKASGFRPSWYRLLTFFLCAIILLAFCLFGWITWKDVRAEVSSTLDPHNRALASTFNGFISRQAELLDTLAVTMDDSPSTQQRLNDILQATPEMRVLAYLDSDYSAIASTGQLKSINWAELFDGERSIGKPFRPSFIGETIVPVRVSMASGHFLVAAYRLVGQDGIWQVSETGPAIRSMIIGADGLIYVSYPETSLFWESFITSTVSPELLAHIEALSKANRDAESLSIDQDELQGESLTFTAQELQDYQLYALSGIDHSVFWDQWISQIKYVALAALLFMVLGAFVVRLVANRANRSESAKDKAEYNVMKLSQAIEQSPSNVVVTDSSWLVEYENKRQTDQQGIAGRAEVGRSLLDFYPFQLIKKDIHDVEHTLNHGDSWFAERFSKEQKQWFSFTVSGISGEDGVLDSYVVVTQDISERKRTEVRLFKQANFDALTGLPNRRRTHDLLEEQLTEAFKHEEKVAVLYMDVDNFKQVNDTFGHILGDQMLQMVALRLQKSVVDRAVACHMSGDEFLIFMRYTDHAMVVEQAEKIMESMVDPMKLEGKKLFVSVSVGIASYPDDSADVIGLLKDADIALYESKNRGRCCYSFFDRELDERNKRKIELESEIRNAVANQEIYMCYQTKNRISNEDVYGFEALMRWKSPRLGFVSPEEFITAAEEIGVIDVLGEFALYQACEDLKRFQGTADEPLNMAVNVSMRQLTHSDVVGTVKTVLEKTQTDPARLELEITESMLAQQLDEVQPILNQLLELGVSLSIDDFGTGYSSLSYLTRFPVSTLKIDRVFVKDMVENKSDATLTHTVITMAHKLGLKVVAEGIEDEAQLALLRVYDCDIGQGYFFSKPLTFDEMVNHLRNKQDKPEWAI
jgi:diguanylate cyclase (GGDEF)-like protein